ncbi:MAG: CinA family protein [Clostridia bacterium]|nr:CinA family protein [Clostridia bacterium]
MIMNNTAKKAVDLLLKNGRTVACAESCTGGLIAKLITDIPGSSEAFHLGAVTYSNDIKNKVLGVEKKTLDTYGAVSEQTAVEMARDVRKLAGADYGVSSTGISGPGGDGICNEAGLSFIAVSTAEKTVCKKLETHSDDREFNRNHTAESALSLLIDIIEK